MDKQTKETIEKLKKEKQYDKIYEQFGNEAYRKNIPKRLRKQELKKLKQERKYFDIYNKYGTAEYEKVLIKAMYEERKENKGILNASLWRIKENIRNATKNLLIVTTGTLLLAPPSIVVTGAQYVKEETEKNRIAYSKEIEDYNTKIEEYAKKVNSMNLSDAEIFMKVMKDMWENIEGYGVPKRDITGFLELDLATEEGVGVCRNMATDVAKKLNAINPKYNARTMVVMLGEEGKYTCANIEQKIVKNDANANNQEEKDGKMIDKILEKTFGNHMVTLVDEPEDNLILVLDPTNPGIGIYKDGEITMLNSDNENGLKFEAKEYSTSFMTKGGLENISGVIEDYARSFEKSKLSPKEIENKYGLKAQNHILDKMKEKDTFIRSLEVKLDNETIYRSQNYKEEQKTKEKEMGQDENER